MSQKVIQTASGIVVARKRIRSWRDHAGRGVVRTAPPTGLGVTDRLAAERTRKLYKAQERKARRMGLEIEKTAAQRYRGLVSEFVDSRRV